MPLDQAWSVLAQVQDWPQWAGHIRRVDVSPPGALGPTSTGTLRLRNGISSTFRMSEFVPGASWKWAGAFLWLTVHYDHSFEALAADRTRLAWTVDAEGFGASVSGPGFASVYAKYLDKAIASLIAALA